VRRSNTQLPVIRARARRPNSGSSPTTPRRRTREDIERVENAIYATLLRDNPQTLRGLFYQLVSQGIVPKTEAAYKTLVGRLAVRMRRAGDLPYHWLADNTRWMRKPPTFSSLEGFLRTTAATYRRAVWDNMPAYVEVWLEKDALAGVLYQVTARWDVPLMVTRGYPSLSFLFEAAETLKAQGKPAYLYYFGDFDPSGVDIPRKVECELRRLASTVDLAFERAAVTEEQIETLRLPTRPTKNTDSRAGLFGKFSVEVDAISARLLREMVESRIRQHVDGRALHALKTAEDSERSILRSFAAEWGTDSASECP
jgi:hypothetical protein